jgi:hypothetical protein
LYAIMLAGLAGAALGCPGEDEPEPEPLFPEDYDASWVEVRDCRGSGDHDLNNIRILADPAALDPYDLRDALLPEGAIVLKEEFDFSDMTCSGDIKQWTVMRKLAAGSSPDTLDWQWQQVDFDRHVVSEDLPRCIGCHTGCGVAPDGHDGTCAMP